jgi:hypothetical protein
VREKKSVWEGRQLHRVKLFDEYSDFSQTSLDRARALLYHSQIITVTEAKRQ